MRALAVTLLEDYFATAKRMVMLADTECGSCGHKLQHHANKGGPPCAGPVSRSPGSFRDPCACAAWQDPTKENLPL